MSKLRVYELAKELNIKPQDVLDSLQGTQYEVKTSSNSIDEDAQKLVRSKVNGAANQQQRKSRQQRQSRQVKQKLQQKQSQQVKQKLQARQNQQRHRLDRRKKQVFLLYLTHRTARPIREADVRLITPMPRQEKQEDRHRLQDQLSLQNRQHQSLLR